MTALRASLITVAVLAAAAMIGYKNCGGPASSTTSEASTSASASSSGFTAQGTRSSEAAKVTTKAVDQAPTTVRDHSRTEHYRPDGGLDYVTTRDREVKRGRRLEAVEAVEASASASTAASSSSTSSSSSSSSTRSSTTSTTSRATWALRWGGELLPAPRGLGQVGVERRLVGPLWASAWAAPSPFELGLGVRLQVGALSLLYAPRLLPIPQLAGVAAVGFHLGGPFDVEAWASLSSLHAGLGLRLAAW